MAFARLFGKNKKENLSSGEQQESEGEEGKGEKVRVTSHGLCMLQVLLWWSLGRVVTLLQCIQG